MDNQKKLELLDANRMLLSFNESEDIDDSFELEKIENQFEEELKSQLSELHFLEEEKEKIGSPDNLGETIKGIVWEQFINQIAVKAGTDFIEENRGLTLDLRKEAHIQTPENFENGVLATHNCLSGEQLAKNYDRYKNTSHKEFRDKYVNPGMDATLKRAGELKKQGIDSVKDIYTGKQIPTNTKLDNGKNNPKAAQREHVNPSAKLYEDPSLQMANSNKELAAIINNPENLQGYTTAERNNRKSDNSPNEMSAQDKNKHWEKAKERADEYTDKVKKEGEERLKEEGLQTRKEEAFRIGGKMLRTVVMQLLAELVKEIIGKLVLWLKEAQRTLKALIEYIKEAIMSFLSKLKTHVINAGSSALTTLATAIIGPIVGLIKKVWVMLKQGWKSLKEAVDYIKNPGNKGMPIDRLILEVGKIVIAGLTGIGAMVLGEIIEKGLMAIPGIGAAFAFEIPMLGSLASLIGIFLGGVIAGIIGAIAINMIQKKIESTQMQENTNSQIEIGNEIVSTQYQLIDIKETKLQRMEHDVETIIVNRHKEAENIIKDSIGNILNNVRSNINDGEEIKKINDGLADLL